MTTKDKTRQLFKFQTCGLTYSVHLATKNAQVLKGNEGVTYAETGMIFVEDTGNQARILDTILHEILHAVFEASGASFTLAIHAKRGVNPNDLEEQIIRTLTPGLLAALTSAKLFSLKIK